MLPRITPTVRPPLRHLPSRWRMAASLAFPPDPQQSSSQDSHCPHPSQCAMEKEEPTECRLIRQNGYSNLVGTPAKDPVGVINRMEQTKMVRLPIEDIIFVLPYFLLTVFLLITFY